MCACTRGFANLAQFLVALVAISKSTSAELLTVADALQTTRILSAMETMPAGALAQAAPRQGEVFASPDGSRCVVLLVQADVVRNGNWLEVRVARLNSLEGASAIKPIARLFTKSLGSLHNSGASALTLPGFNTVGWLDNDTIVLLWDKDGIVQVATVNLVTGLVSYLTNHPTHVTRFDLGREGDLIYTALAPRDEAASAKMLRDGFTVESPDAVSVLLGEFKGRITVGGRTERFIYRGRDRSTRAITSGGKTVNPADLWQPIAFSPDGQHAIMDWAPASIPDSWSQYADPTFATLMRIRARKADQSGDDGIGQLQVLDMPSGSARPLWNAPLKLGSQVAWSPDGKAVLVGPTFLPIEGGSAAGRQGAAIAEVDVATGRFLELPLSEKDARGVIRIRWRRHDLVELVRSEGRALAFMKRAGLWKASSREHPQPVGRASAQIRIEVREDIHTPPTLVAIDAWSGKERTVLDPNPNLRERFSLGDVQRVDWRDHTGRVWNGRLYFPVEYVRGSQYPLVIQTTVPVPENRFSLFGGGENGLGANYSVYAAQVLANRGIAVLQFEETIAPELLATPKEPMMYMMAYEAAAEHLVASGLALRNKVGLVGFSRSGWYVEYALSHSDFPYAAAIVVDNFDAGYVQAALTGWDAEVALNNGAEPFGDGLRTWLETAPAFNVERVRAPLQLQVHSGGVPGVIATAWEMFARLRHLKKPTELYVIPDVEHGSHAIQNPAQCLAAQVRAVDWFDFWLNSHEDPDSAKAQQYARWRVLAQQSAAQDERAN